MYVPRLNFKPFDVAISEGSHVAVGISSVGVAGILEILNVSRGALLNNKFCVIPSHPKSSRYCRRITEAIPSRSNNSKSTTLLHEILAILEFSESGNFSKKRLN